MAEKHCWLGGVHFKLGTTIDYISRNPLALTIFTKSIFSQQAMRSYNLAQVEKMTIWDTKNMFVDEVNRLILQEN